MARIMIAEDDDQVRESLKEILKIKNHEVISEAINGGETLEKFNATKPDILFLDITMPIKNGIIVLKEIMFTDPKAKIIMLTANDAMETIVECIQSGAVAYLIKPFDMDSLYTSIQMALDK